MNISTNLARTNTDRINKTPEEQRIQAWQDKQEKESLGLAFKTKPLQASEDEKIIKIAPEFKGRDDLNASQKAEVVKALQSAVSGSTSEEYSRQFIAEAVSALQGSPYGYDSLTNGFTSAMLGLIDL